MKRLVMLSSVLLLVLTGATWAGPIDRDTAIVPVLDPVLFLVEAAIEGPSCQAPVANGPRAWVVDTTIDEDRPLAPVGWYGVCELACSPCRLDSHCNDPFYDRCGQYCL